MAEINFPVSPSSPTFLPKGEGRKSPSPFGRGVGVREGYWMLLAILAASMALGAPLPPVVDGQPLPSLAPMLERVIPAVVNISTETTLTQEENPLLRDPLFRFFFDTPRPRKRQQNSLGSGVIVDAARGYILTNHHVVDKADTIHATLRDGRSLAAKLVGADPETDVAVLQVASDRLAAIPLGRSDALRVGDFVVAIGSPFGLGQTVTSGIVSALGRSGLGIEGYENFIQTDASINPGNSGGPLVNLRGELVGINTAILAPSGGNVGIGFAIPVQMASAIMEQIVTHGAVHRGVLGVNTQDITPELAGAMGIAVGQGVVINEVQPDSPAARSGLRVGDVVDVMNGHPIHSTAEFRTAIGTLRVGSSVTLEVLRQGRRQTIRSEVADPLADYLPGERVNARFKGALLGDTKDHSHFGQFDAVAVGKVEERSPAWQLGLRTGDVILELNDQPVDDIKTLTRLSNKSRRQFFLKIRRDNQLLLLLPNYG
ncbi:Periplasmic serine endoprotease DegP [Gammaproteobacteria bacterium]